MNQIDFSRFDGPLFAGRARGQKARDKVSLDELELQPDSKFVVIFPPNFFTMTSSFFLGLFGKSIQQCGSKQTFLEKFDFSTAPEETKKQIFSWIDRALSDKGVSYL